MLQFHGAAKESDTTESLKQQHSETTSPVFKSLDPLCPISSSLATCGCLILNVKQNEVKLEVQPSASQAITQLPHWTVWIQVRTPPWTLQKVPLDKTALVQGSTTLSCKGKYWNSKYFRLRGPYSVVFFIITQLWCHAVKADTDSAYWQVWLNPHKTFTKTGGELDLAQRPSFANLYPRPSPPLCLKLARNKWVFKTISIRKQNCLP